MESHHRACIALKAFNEQLLKLNNKAASLRDVGGRFVNFPMPCKAGGNCKARYNIRLEKFDAVLIPENKGGTPSLKVVAIPGTVKQ